MDALTFAGINMSLSKGGFTAGTTTTITTTAAIISMIQGKLYSKSAITNGTTPTTDILKGAAFTGIVANQGTVFIFGLNAGGTVVAAQGSIEALDTSGNFIRAPQLPPSLGKDYAPFGMLVVKGGSTLSGTWTLGSSNLSSVTGMTYSFSDIGVRPPRPVVA